MNKKITISLEMIWVNFVKYQYLNKNLISQLESKENDKF